MATREKMRNVILCVGLVALAGCNTPAGNDMFHGTLGQPTANNVAVETGQKGYAIDLSRRFAKEVHNTVNFAFDSAVLDPSAQAILREQATWIRQFPEVRFRVFGYTDLVGSEAYNKTLGMRRARAVVAYLASQGISRSRLEAVVSYGKTQPLIPVQAPERANRRALTDVSGFVKNNSMLLDGQYAAIIYRSYVASAQPATVGGSVATSGAAPAAPTK